MAAVAATAAQTATAATAASVVMVPPGLTGPRVWMEPVAVLAGTVAMAAVAEPFLEMAEMAALRDSEVVAAMAAMAQKVLMEWRRVPLAEMVATPAMAPMAAQAATAVLVV